MPFVSKYKLPLKTERDLIEGLNLVLSSLDRRDEMLKFLNSLLTETEKLMLAKRLSIIVLIKEGVSDSDISEALHVTRITASKMRYLYEARAKEGFDIAIMKIKNDKALANVKKFLLDLANYSVKAAGGRL